MQNNLIRITGLGAAALSLPMAGSLAAAKPASQPPVTSLSKPNIVFILADDLGWRDLSCYGSTFHETPNIDRLAARGVMFTQAYADSPLCSPTRASIQTGLHPARLGITAPACHENFVRLEKKLGDPDPKSKVLQAKSLTRLKTEYFTLAEAFREAGYTTAHFGKWHIGHNLPNRKNDRFEPKDQGFDSDFPHTPTVGGPVTGFFAPWKFIKDPPLEGKAGEHIEDRMSSEAEKFILAHASTGSEQAKKPFYLNYCAYSVHMPAHGKTDYVEHFKKRADPKNPQNNPVYAAMVKSLDDAVGRLMNAVDQAGIADRTIIVFFSDNGGNVDPPKVTVPEGYENKPLACNYPLRSGKLSLYEGGTREPCIIVWPGKIKSGTENGALFQSVDFYPTLLAMCGLKPHADIKLDGLNQEGALLGGASPRDRIFCHFPHGNEKIPIPGFLPGTYVRKGDWKLIRFYADNDDGSDRLELYNLKDDVGETRNLAADNPEIVKDLNGLISGFLKDTDAVIPVRNPDYSAAPGGIDWIKIECSDNAADSSAQPAPELKPGSTLGTKINSEALRAKNIEARIDGAKTAAETLAALHEGWTNPPSTYRTHTRWWWPGNAVTKEGIDFQLQEMKDKGFGGVEIMSSSRVYEKGNIEFGSPEFFEMVNYTVSKAHELGMFVTPPLGPGWNLGHGWVPEANRSKALVISEQDAQGGQSAEYALIPPAQLPYVRTAKKLEAVVAVKLNAKGVPDCGERIDLSSAVKGKNDFAVKPDLKVRADLPSGKWKIMTFWTAFSGQKCASEDYDPKSAVADHLDANAVRDCADYMVGKYRALFGEHFGQTVDSFFNDSFELHQDFTLWSTNLFDRFQREKGYDLRPYLPMIKYDGAPETPYVRYDVGSFLHGLGMEGAIGTLADCAAENNVHMRQQPHYRFVTELIEASGRLQRAETENTKRSFDPVFWHKLTTSGAQLYPSKEKKWTSAEAFTFINTRYRTTMEEIKRATDLFLRDGVTQFYNHGYFYSPEKELEPARDMGYMSRISHVNTWWPWYRGLADYQARGAFLSRQGRADSSVLVYSPMPTEWAKQVDFPLKHVRHIPFSSLLKILVASGYDFDCVNDDLLQKFTTVQNGKLEINGYKYSVLIMPKVEVLAPETLAVIDRFVRAGGTVFALNTLPKKTTGLINHVKRDNQQVKMLADLFELKGGVKTVGKGTTYFLPKCDEFEYQKTLGQVFEWSPTEPLTPAYAEFVKDLRSHLVPDFEIAGTPLSNGLTFRHTRIGQVDAWFICNLQPNAQRTDVILNTEKRFPQIWDPMTGQIKSAPVSRVTDDGRLALPVDLQPWDSCFVLLTAKPEGTLPPVRRFGSETLRAVEGAWSVEFSGIGGKQHRMNMSKLVDWATVPELKEFSGSALYTIDIDLPAEFAGKTSAVFLDLGDVHEVAQVLVNGTEAGKVWMQPYRVEVSGLLKTGKNKIQIRAANLVWNYTMGLENPTPIPEELQAHYGTTWNKDCKSWETLQNHKRINKNDRLPSGLLGPVTLRISTETTKQ